MRTERYCLVGERVRRQVQERLAGLALDGKTEITIADARGRSARQRGLMWIWNHDVADSGMGGAQESTPDQVHLSAKRRFAVPILRRDSNFFAELLTGWKRLHHDDEAALWWFVKHQVSTSKFSTAQMAEYLTRFQVYYSNLGVRLTDPQDRRLLQR